MIEKNKGFTLIELLIVIAIIGILSTVILTSLSNARAKAYDSKIKQQLSSFRTAAEVYFNNQEPNSYNTTGNPVISCANGMFSDINSENGAPGLYLDQANLPDFAIPVCGAGDSGLTYAVKVPLYSGTDYWCVDNRGFSGLVLGVPVSSTSCP